MDTEAGNRAKETVACVIPLFNFAGNPLVEANHARCVAMLSQEASVFTIRGYLSKTDTGLATVDDGWLVPCEALWQKEALINLAVSLLPPQYSVVAWVDSGVYLSPGWSGRVLQAIDNGCDIVQPFSEGYWLATNGAIDKRRRGIVALHQRHLQPILSSTGLTVGMAWAAKRSLLEETPLYDRAITGGGDSWCALGYTEITHEARVFTDVGALAARHGFGWVKATQERGYRAGYVTGSYYHLWHLSDARRSYRHRHKILARYGYRPDRHVGLADNGTLAWADSAPRDLPEALRGWLLARLPSPREGRL